VRKEQETDRDTGHICHEIKIGRAQQEKKSASSYALKNRF
jgi:hypothetical protein